MGDLDDLASAGRASGRAARPPVSSGGAKWVWIAAGAAILAIVLGAYWFIRSETASTPPTTTATVAPGAAQETTARPDAAAPSPPTTAAAAGIGTRSEDAAPAPPARTSVRPPLRDIVDPYQALEIYHLQRGAGDTLEIKARNLSKRGLFVRSVDLFAESNDRAPLWNIGFWLPPGESVNEGYVVPELSRRLGRNEAVRAVINEAEFRDEPPEELAAPKNPAEGDAADRS
jgi:hypothetical protein